MVSEPTSQAIQLVELKPQPAIAIRTVVPMAGADIGGIFGAAATRLTSYESLHSFGAAGAPYARYWEFSPDRLDMEVGIPVDADLSDLSDLQPDEVMGASELPGCRAVRLLHVGAYRRLGEIYERLEGYLRAESLSPSGPPWESYVVTPEAVDGDESRLETVVSWPV